MTRLLARASFRSRSTVWLCRWRSAHRVDSSDTRTFPPGSQALAGSDPASGAPPHILIGVRGRGRPRYSASFADASSAAPIGVPAVLNPMDEHDLCFVVDLVHDAIVTATRRPEPAQLTHEWFAHSMRVVGESAEHQRDRRIADLRRESLKVSQTFRRDLDLVQAQPARWLRKRSRSPRAACARERSIEAISSESRTMSRVSSSDSRSSGLISTNDGRPLRVTRMRSCSSSTLSANSERWLFASENGTVSPTGQNSDPWMALAQPSCVAEPAFQGTHYRDYRTRFPDGRLASVRCAAPVASAAPEQSALVICPAIACPRHIAGHGAATVTVDAGRTRGPGGYRIWRGSGSSRPAG
jgi:hypothetical protein